MNPRSDAPKHAFEVARLAAVREMEPLAREDDDAMLRIAREATESCTAPIGVVSLMEETEERVLAAVGVERHNLARRDSICARTILEPYVLVVEDLAQDARFRTLPYVAGHPHLRFYAGAPILDVTGLPLGAVCVFHTRPHRVSPGCQRALARLAGVASAMMEARFLLANAGNHTLPASQARTSQARLDALMIAMIEPRPSCG